MKTQRCAKCKRPKPETAFSWSKKDVKRKSTCKDCDASYMLTRRRDIMAGVHGEERKQAYLAMEKRANEKRLARSPEKERARRRARKRHGPASKHICVDCKALGKFQTATEWDHPRGYTDGHETDVEAVCSIHNAQRQRDRGEKANNGGKTTGHGWDATSAMRGESLKAEITDGTGDDKRNEDNQDAGGQGADGSPVDHNPRDDGAGARAV